MARTEALHRDPGDLQVAPWSYGDARERRNPQPMMKSSSRGASLRRDPLRTVRASFPAYRSSLNQILRQEDRKIPPTTYSLFSFGKLSLTMTRLSLFSAILQVIIPRGIKRIGIPLYLGVTPYRRICRERKRDISVLSVPFCLHTEDPVSIPLLNEVTTFHPPPGFFWMPPACPIPDRPPDFRGVQIFYGVNPPISPISICCCGFDSEEYMFLVPERA